MEGFKKIYGGLKSLNKYINPQLRDFTIGKENELAGITKAPYSEAEAILAYIWNMIGRFVDKYSFSSVILRVGGFTEAVKSLYGYCSDTIHKIFTAARNIDSDYGSKVSVNVDQANAVNALIEGLTQTLDIRADLNDVGSLTNAIMTNLREIDHKMIQYTNSKGEEISLSYCETFNRINEMAKKEGLTDEEIWEFVFSAESEDCFAQTNERIFHMSIDIPIPKDKKDAWNKYYLGWILSGGPIEQEIRTKLQLLGIIENKVLNWMHPSENVNVVHAPQELVENGFMPENATIEQTAISYTDDPLAIGYHENKIKQLLKGIMKDSIDVQERKSGAQKEDLDIIKRIIDDKDAKKEAGNDSVIDEMIGDFIKDVGGKDVCKEIEQASSDVFDWLYYDYSTGIKTLRLLRSSTTDKEMISAISSLEDDYRQRFKAVASEVLEHGVDTISVMSNVTISEMLFTEGGNKAIGLTMEAFNYDEYVEGYGDLLELKKIEATTKAAYVTTKEKIRVSGQQLGEIDQADVEQLETLFSLEKATTIQCLKAYDKTNPMKGIDGGEEETWINGEIDRYRKMEFGKQTQQTTLYDTSK